MSEPSNGRWWLSRLSEDTAIITMSAKDYSHVPHCSEVEVHPVGTAARLSALEAEVARLAELLYGARCAYCGEIVGKDRKNQDIGDEVLRQHIKTCPKHPLAALRAEVAALREERRERPMSEHPIEDEEAVLLRVRNRGIIPGVPRVDVYAPGEWREVGGWHTWEGNPIDDEDSPVEYLGWLPMPTPKGGEG